ncbi:MAG: (d)CMP kinase [Ruminococcus sp.]
MSIAIAIDGPAGAGKSTIAKLAAKELNFIYVDTGALYRTVGLAATRNNVEAKPSEELDELLDKIKVELAFNENNEQIVLLDGEDVSDLIRTPQASMMASAISAVPAVRAYLLDLQRNIAKTNNVIMDGRDIGTVVLPDAKIKIFLSADPEDRAKRRYDELVEKGMDVKYEDILEDVKTRDYNDSHREIAPLKPAEDSILVNTTGNTLEQSVELLIKIMKENM